MLSEIQTELRRVVGAAGADASLEEHDDLGTAVRLETADAVRHLPPQELLDALHDLPDRAGPLALLEALDEWGRISEARG